MTKSVHFLVKRNGIKGFKSVFHSISKFIGLEKSWSKNIQISTRNSEENRSAYNVAKRLSVKRQKPSYVNDCVTLTSLDNTQKFENRSSELNTKLCMMKAFMLKLRTKDYDFAQ